ncbi:MAG: 3'-5' exonuclease [Bacilli bacterium]|nr:3'-5' exonuclease [Bacilli bacterium]
MESGGLDDSKHSLLGLGFVVYVNNKIVDEMEIFIKKENYCVEKEAMKVNKIDLNWLKQYGITEKEALLEIKQFLNKHFPKERALLGGHNIYFDIAFLKKLYHENNQDFSKYFQHRTIDTCFIMKFLYFCGKLPKEVQSLTSASNYFKIELNEKKRHETLYDAELTAKVFTKLMQHNKQ